VLIGLRLDGSDGTEMFHSPNGTCTSQSEAKHIPAVKDPWQRTSRDDPLRQMLQTISRLDKLTALRRAREPEIVNHFTGVLRGVPRRTRTRVAEPARDEFFRRYIVWRGRKCHEGRED
jgi:hypothetical protein